MQARHQYPLRRRAAGRNYSTSGRTALATVRDAQFWCAIPVSAWFVQEGNPASRGRRGNHGVPAIYLEINSFLLLNGQRS